MTSTETVSIGIQNNNTPRILFPSRLAAKNSAKNNSARVQKRGEKALHMSPPATAFVASGSLIPFENSKGQQRAYQSRKREDEYYQHGTHKLCIETTRPLRRVAT
jgi:hypothetical protein